MNPYIVATAAGIAAYLVYKDAGATAPLSTNGAVKIPGVSTPPINYEGDDSSDWQVIPYGGSYKTEADLKVALSDLYTPEANAKRRDEEASDASIFELQDAIAREKNPAQRKVLEDYLDSILMGTH